MNKKTKIISEFARIATDAFGTVSGVRKEIETIVKIKIEKIISKSNLVKREEFETLKFRVDKISKKNQEFERFLKTLKSKKTKKKSQKK